MICLRSGPLRASVLSFVLASASVFAMSCRAADPASGAEPPATPATTATATATATATFAGGCFWCMEGPYDALDGVLATISGYTGGQLVNPTYEQVSSGGTGHAEALQVTYDPAKVTYERLLDVFWHNIDPVSREGQFCDRGNQYRSAVFYHDEAQRAAAETSLAALKANQPFKGEIATQVVAAGPFYAAEDYHQDYYRKNPLRYKYYRYSCGRDQRLTELWGTTH